MIHKSSNIFYAFDFDGTLMGDNHWINFRTTTKAAFTKGPYVNPNEEFDIRWSILTGRPKCDKPIVWYACHSKGLHPENIFMYPAWYHNYTPEEVLDYKVQFLKDVIDAKIDVDGNKKVRAFYVDNDLELVAKMNSKKEHYPILAMSLIEFRKGDFNYMV
jgi:hypothetical protein